MRKKNRIVLNLPQLSLLPAALLLILWPCLVHMDNVRTGLQDMPWFPDVEVQSDFFMHCRSVSLIFLAVCMAVVLVDRGLLQRKKVFSKKLFWPLLVYALLAVLSAIFSANRDFCLTGMSEQYETIWVLLSYLAIFWYFHEEAKKTDTAEMLIQMLLVGAALQAVIGFTQIIGHDFWSTAFGKWLILLGTDSGQTLQYAFAADESRRVYLSFYNPNYAAVYLILVLPVSVRAAFCLKKKWQRTAAGILAGMLLVCLWGTGSKAGVITLLLLVLTGGMLYLRTARKRLFLLMAVIICTGTYAACSYGLTGTSVFHKLYKNVFPKEKSYKLQEVSLQEDAVEVIFDGLMLLLRMEEEDGLAWFSISDEDGKNYPLNVNESGRFTLDSPKYPNLEFEAYRENGNQVIVMYRNEIPWHFEKAPEDETYRFVNLYGKQDVPENAAYAFGKGFERAFSARVYLWSRTVPLLKNYLFIGSGPDTFALVFPQNDYVTRANISLEMLMEIISRPHSFYLQTAVQTGVLSLAVLLVFFGRYLAGSWRQMTGTNTAARKKEICAAGKEDRKFTLRMALFLSVLGFLIMGIANDSVVVVSPVFWAVLGVGYALTEPEKEKAK